MSDTEWIAEAIERAASSFRPTLTLADRERIVCWGILAAASARARRGDAIAERIHRAISGALVEIVGAAELPF